MEPTGEKRDQNNRHLRRNTVDNADRENNIEAFQYPFGGQLPAHQLCRDKINVHD
jgi:hypothetical protein